MANRAYECRVDREKEGEKGRASASVKKTNERAFFRASIKFNCILKGHKSPTATSSGNNRENYAMHTPFSSSLLTPPPMTLKRNELQYAKRERERPRID